MKGKLPLDMPSGKWPEATHNYQWPAQVALEQVQWWMGQVVGGCRQFGEDQSSSGEGKGLGVNFNSSSVGQILSSFPSSDPPSDSPQTYTSKNAEGTH